MLVISSTTILLMGHGYYGYGLMLDLFCHAISSPQAFPLVLQPFARTGYPILMSSAPAATLTMVLWSNYSAFAAIGPYRHTTSRGRTVLVLGRMVRGVWV